MFKQYRNRDEWIREGVKQMIQILSAIIAVALVLLLVACNVQSNSDVVKTCDGSRAIYRDTVRGGVAVVENASECPVDVVERLNKAADEAGVPR